MEIEKDDEISLLGNTPRSDAPVESSAPVKDEEENFVVKGLKKIGKFLGLTKEEEKAFNLKAIKSTKRPEVEDDTPTKKEQTKQRKRSSTEETVLLNNDSERSDGIASVQQSPEVQELIEKMGGNSKIAIEEKVMSPLHSHAASHANRENKGDGIAQH